MELARRVELLLTAFHPGQDLDVVADSVLAGVAEKGSQLSREQWNAIRAGEFQGFEHEHTLTTLGAVLGATGPYLTHRNVEHDDRLEAQLELVIVLKETGVVSFNACGPTPRTAEQIRELVNVLRTSAQRRGRGSEPAAPQDPDNTT